jgi:DNA-binding MarR family transcriptional regulator
MDLITQLGPLALASRLRRLSERLSRDASRIYQDHKIEFEAPWFPVMYLLGQRSPMAVTSIARALGITHPAVNQLAQAMAGKDLVVAARDAEDDRRRLLSLSAKGRRMLSALEPIWAEIEAATRELIAGRGTDVLAALSGMERDLDRQPMYQRVAARLKQRQYEAVEIVAYRPAYKRFFRDLNYEWLNEHFSVEAVDERILSDPNRQIIKPGGDILFARVGREIVGTVALVRVDRRTFELAKMAVTERFRGRQIGRRLAEAAIGKAREKKAKTVILHTSPKLEAAVGLYSKLGFASAPPGPATAEYRRCTIAMKLDLTKKRAIP